MPLSRIKDRSLLQTGAYINGQWINTGRTFAVRDPGTGKTIAEICNAGEKETCEAIDAATAAFQGWRNRTARERSNIVRRWFELIQEHRDDLATMITAEGGKPYAEAIGEVAYAASFVEWFAEEARRINGEIVPPNTNNKRLLLVLGGTISPLMRRASSANHSTNEAA